MHRKPFNTSLLTSPCSLGRWASDRLYAYSEGLEAGNYEPRDRPQAGQCSAQHLRNWDPVLVRLCNGKATDAGGKGAPDAAGLEASTVCVLIAKSPPNCRQLIPRKALSTCDKINSWLHSLLFLARFLCSFPPVSSLCLWSAHIHLLPLWRYEDQG